MRIKPLLIASAAAGACAAGARPASARSAGAGAAANQYPNNSIGPTVGAARHRAREHRGSAGAGRERGRGSQRRSTCRRRRRRSNIRAGRAATRGPSACSIPAAMGLGADAVGRCERRLPVDADAADGHADRVALGAYRAARRAARQGARAARRQSGRLGRRARLAAACGWAKPTPRGCWSPGVDTDRFTPKMVQVAVQSALANADPPALCPIEDGIRKYDPQRARAGPGDVLVARRRAGDARRRRSTTRAASAASAGSTWRSPQKVVGAGADTGAGGDDRMGSGRSA